MSDCLFCRIVAGEIPASIVASGPHALAFRDIAPQAPVHVLVIPRRHVDDVAGLLDHPGELVDLFAMAAQAAAAEGVAEGGYRLVTNTGVDGGQAVYHAHLHVLGGRRLGWPPG
jgi:histidine triad (HIT) family protein